MNKVTSDSPITRQPSLTSVEAGHIDKSLARPAGAGMVAVGTVCGIGAATALVYQVYPPAIASGIFCVGCGVSGIELVSRSIKIEHCCHGLCMPKCSPDMPTSKEIGIEMASFNPTSSVTNDHNPE